MKKEVQALKSQVIELQKSIADSNLRMEELSNSIFILQETSKSNKESIKQLAQPRIIIQGETPPAESYLETAQNSEPAPLPQGGTGPAGYGTNAIRGTVGNSIPVSESVPGEPAEFAMAKSNYSKNNFGLAVFDFTSFLAKNPAGVQAEQALYLLGMSYFKLNEFAQAAREWSKLLSRFPQSQNAAEATYRMGVAYNALGDRDRAKTYFDLAAQKYPGSEWAAKSAGALKK